MRLKFLLAGTTSAIIGLSGKVVALDPKDLPALQAAVHEFCVQPDRKGDYLKIEGDLDAGATLKIVGLGATGKITKETWDGINQRLDQYKTDPRQCAISIVGILAPLLTTPIKIGPPDAVLISEPGKLTLYNRSAQDLQIWGDKFDGEPAKMEPAPRRLPRDGNYYFLTDRLQAYAASVIGTNGDKLEPFEVYISTADAGEHYTVYCQLLLKMHSGDFSVHAQNLGFDKGGW